ncbi:transcriptional regulator, TetR family [Desulfocicer vacuolatum DSM 3385]|uniref:Transcriptional regulator, TetR family n=1 Tax=Desulfocicer vacuolatum DSM 3385 TaxID=1121400 RepID=A0A1W2DS84_9BACT|nr:TetR family transcriptional regulator [Desulfocicer vacuolatum]SMD00320.1 transcriptional regulator, TetR family [Desulfocicer vacuolatum DSM 3385]
MSEPNTKNKILDVGERLFAQNGYDRTSLREITAKAGVNLAAVSYHFGSKDKLFEAILKRRITPLNEIREHRMHRVIKTAKARHTLPSVEELLLAFIEPTLEFIDNTPESLDFFIIVNRCTMESNGVERNCFIKLMQPTLMKFYHPLCESLPRLSKEVVFMRFMFAIGSMVHTIRMLKMMNQNPEKNTVIPHKVDLSVITEELIKFVTSGMENP